MAGPTISREFLAFFLTTALFAAALLPLLRPVFQRWLRLFWSSRIRAALSLALLLAFVYIGGSLDKQNGGAGPSLRTGGSPALPLFYYDLGYPTADTDGDGIPDYWERRTHTNRLVPDAAADYDHDGVDKKDIPPMPFVIGNSSKVVFRASGEKKRAMAQAIAMRKTRRNLECS